METSTIIRNFKLSQMQGFITLTAQEFPWSVLQVVPATPETFDDVCDRLRKRPGFVAHHDTDRTFCIIHVGSGDHDGKHPEHYIDISKHLDWLDDLKDTMAQAVTWYYTNVVAKVAR